MKNLQAFFLTYAILMFSTILMLSLLGEDRIDVYVALFALEFFMGSELTSPFSSALHRRKTLIEVMFLAVFAAIVVERIIEILRYGIT